MRAGPGPVLFGRRCASGLLSAIGLLALGLWARVAAAQTSGDYEIDAKNSRIEIHVFRSGAFAGLGDDHQLELTRFSGTASRAEGKPWQARVVAEAASMTVLDPKLSESSRREVHKTMLGPTQLDVARFPAIVLSSRRVAFGDAARSLRLETDLTVHGVTRSVEFPVVWSEDERDLRVKGTKQLFLRDFGIEPIRKFLGTIQVRNDFEVVYDIRLTRRN